MSSPTVKSNIVNIPKMTVLLVSRERQKKLTDVIQSLIITSKYKSDIQFLIAVDSDDDSTIKCCHDLALKYKNINIICEIFERKTYLNLHEYMNELVEKHSRSDLLLFWGDDIFMKPEKFWDEIIYEEYFKKNYGAYFVPCHHIVAGWKSSFHSGRSSTGPWAMPRSLYDKIDGFPGVWYDDWVRLISQESGCYFIVKELTSNHDRSGDNISAQSAKIRKKMRTKNNLHSPQMREKMRQCVNRVRDHIARLNND